MPKSFLCPSCHLSVDETTPFCTNCGFNLAGVTTCNGCSASLEPGMKFCNMCGAPVQNERTANDGFVKDGEWHKGDSELARYVSMNDLQKQFQMGGVGRSSIQIPNGCIALIVENGRVTEILPPGKKTTEGFFESIWNRVKEFVGGDEKPVNLWLLDKRDIPIAFSFERTKDKDLRETVQSEK